MLFDGVLVGAEDVLLSGEGANQHEQSGLGQVEVGEHGVHDAEGVAGIDKNVSFARARLDAAVTGSGSGEFERAHTRGTDSNDAALLLSGSIDGSGGFGRNRIAL